MKFLRFFSLLIFFSLIVSIRFLSAASILTLKNSENGSECCKKSTSERKIEVKLLLTLNANSIDAEAYFPLKIKAFAFPQSSFNIGESLEIGIEDFTLIETTGLMIATVPVDISTLQVFRMRFYDAIYECEIDEFYIEADFHFKIFSDQEELDINCSLFQSPHLNQSTIDITQTIYICQEVLQGNLTTREGSQSSKFYSEVTNLSDSPSIFDRNDENQRDEEKFNIYPIPANQEITIELPNLYTPRIELELYSSRSILKSLSYENYTGGKIQIKLEEIPAGIYFIRSKFNQTVLLNKILVIK